MPERYSYALSKNGHGKNSYSSASNNKKYFSSFKLIFKHLEVKFTRTIYDLGLLYTEKKNLILS